MTKIFLAALLVLSSTATVLAQSEINTNGTWKFFYAKNEQVADSLAKTNWIKSPLNTWD